MDIPPKSRTTILLGLLALPFVTTLALADAIDGDWCNIAGRRMTIHGSEIVTPGGKQIRGDYSRHFFSYIIPEGEAGAGATTSITLLGEHLAHARVGNDPTIVEWRRCQPGIS